MNAAAWIPLIVQAIEIALEQGKRLGLPAPTGEQLLAAANEAAAKVLPGSAAALEVLVAVTAARLGEKIDSLGDLERCHTCGGVLTVHTEKDVHAGTVSRRTTCSNCDKAG